MRFRPPEFALTPRRTAESRMRRQNNATSGSCDVAVAVGYTFTSHPNRLLKTANGGSLYTTVVDRFPFSTLYRMANRLISGARKDRRGAGLAKTLVYQYTDSLLSQTTYPPPAHAAARTYNAHRLLYQTQIGGVTQATFTYDTADRRSPATALRQRRANQLDARRQQPHDRSEPLDPRHAGDRPARMDLQLHER